MTMIQRRVLFGLLVIVSCLIALDGQAEKANRHRFNVADCLLDIGMALKKRP